MKGIFRKIFSLVLVGVFLLSSCGIVLAKHICLDNAHKTVSLFEKISCCDAEDDFCSKPGNDTKVSAPTCCLTEFSYHKVDVTSGSALSDNLIVSLPVSFDAEFSAGIFFQDQKTVQYDRDHPLPGYGKQLLLSIHCLLV